MRFDNIEKISCNTKLCFGFSYGVVAFQRKTHSPYVLPFHEIQNTLYVQVYLYDLPYFTEDIYC